MTIDWTQAPAWAQYHAFDKDGMGWWYEHEPICATSTGWWWSAESIGGSGYAKPAGQDWQKSLIERPKEETK